MRQRLFEFAQDQADKLPAIPEEGLFYDGEPIFPDTIAAAEYLAQALFGRGLESFADGIEKELPDSSA